MKVLLVNPMPAGLMRVGTPMSIGYVGASLKKAGHVVRILDQTLRNQPQLREVLVNYKPEVVGITGYSDQYPSMKDVAYTSKKFGCMVAVGGVHCSAYTKYVLNDCGSIDFVIKGEGEYSFLELLSKGSPVGAPGIYYRNSGHPEGKKPELIEDLDSIPFPWEVLNPRDYSIGVPAGVVTRHSPVASVLTSRGCPYGCTFCCASVVHGKKIRLRSVGNILDEMEFLVKKGIKEINIIDDNFTFYPEHVLGVCKGIKERGLKFSWTLTNGIRADKVNREILKEMRNAGCYYLAVGVESGSEKILKEVSKSLSLGAVERTVREADNLGFITQGFFMVGFPGETIEDRERSLRFAVKLPLDRACVAPVMALPGSELFNSQFGDRLDEYDWKQAGVKNWKPMPGAPDYKTVRKFIRSMRFRFYLNPIRNIKHILKVRTLHQALGMLKGLRAVVKE
jgi:radical SAM superfamily enzyme YgiQ (UPF0313 family)